MKKQIKTNSKVIRFIIITLSLTMLTLTSACGVFGGGSKAFAVCDKFDECHSMPSGLSMDVCVETLERNLKNYSKAGQADWNTTASRCLEYKGCGITISCFSNSGLFK